MQWTKTCILLVSIALISASSHGVRSKRDLSFLKKFFLSKIFGSYVDNNTTPVQKQNYRLFRVPGFDNILVKAVPKVAVVEETGRPSPSVVVEESDTVPVHPSIAIVSRYLGTERLNDTLSALKGVKDLLQSGVLTAQRDNDDNTAGINKKLPSVLVESPKIVVEGANRTFMMFPSYEETLTEGYRPALSGGHPKLPIPTTYPYKQVNRDGVTSYSANNNQNVTVEETKRPIPFPSTLSVRIQDILSSLGVYSIPTSPVMLKGVQMRPLPVSAAEVTRFEVPYSTGVTSNLPSDYPYNQAHRDGPLTSFSGDVSEVQGHKPTVITEISTPPMSIVMTGTDGLTPYSVFNTPRIPYPINTVNYPYSKFGYYIPRYSEERPAVMITEHGRPTVVVGNVEGPPAPFPVFNTPSVKVPSSYSYNQVHQDGSITRYSGPGQVAKHGGERTRVVITEPGSPTMVVADVQGPPAPFPVVNVPSGKEPAKSGNLHNQFHDDVSVTTHSGAGPVNKNEVDKTAVLITKPGRPTIVLADVAGPPSPFPAFNTPKIPSSSGYSYNQVRDGSVTTHAGSGHVKEHVGERPGLVITEPGRPTMVVADVHGPPAPFPVFNVPSVKVPSNSGYSYSQLHEDGSETTHSGSGHVAEHGVEKTAVVITEPGRPTVVVEDVDGPPAPVPVYNSQRVKVPSSGYPDSHEHKDGSLTSYSGAEHVVQYEIDKPGVVITEPGRPTVVLSDVEGPPAPFPVYNVPQVKVPSSGYSYDHVHNDGSVTSYSGSGHVMGHEAHMPSVVMTEYGRPTVVVDDVIRPPAFLPAYNVPHMRVPSSSGYSYNNVHKDNLVTAYSGSGQVLGHEGYRPAVVMTEHRTPTVVLDAEGPPAPFSVFNPQNVSPTGSGYSYNQIRNDGTVTKYSGLGQIVTDTKRPLPLPTYLTGRIQNVVISAGAGRLPTDFYGTPGPMYHTVAEDERPNDVYHAKHDHFGIPHQRGQVNMHSLYINNELSSPTSNVPAGYSYQTVHGDGSVTSYTHAGAAEGGRPMIDRPALYPTGPDHIVEEHIVKMVDCKNSSHEHNSGHTTHVKDNSHNDAVNRIPSNFSDTRVSEGGSSTTFSGSGYVEKNKPDNSAHEEVTPVTPMVDPPVLVTETNDDNPEKVMLTPVMSKYVYKQINHHKPDQFDTIVNVGDDVPVGAKVNMKGNPDVSGNTELPSVEVAKIPEGYVFVPPTNTDEPVPLKESVEIAPTSNKTQPESMPTSSEAPVASSFISITETIFNYI